MFITKVSAVLVLWFLCYANGTDQPTKSTASIVCDVDRSQLVVDVLATTTILHIPCEIKNIDGQKIGRGAMFASSMMALLQARKAAQNTTVSGDDDTFGNSAEVPNNFTVVGTNTRNSMTLGNSSTGNIYQGAH